MSLTNMDANHRIKIIKLAERKLRAKARCRNDRASAGGDGQAKASDAATTVTGWIKELRLQKQQSVDTMGGFDSLFEEAV